MTVIPSESQPRPFLSATTSSGPSGPLREPQVHPGLGSESSSTPQIGPLSELDRSATVSFSNDNGSALLQANEPATKLFALGVSPGLRRLDGFVLAGTSTTSTETIGEAHPNDPEAVRREEQQRNLQAMIDAQRYHDRMNPGAYELNGGEGMELQEIRRVRRTRLLALHIRYNEGTKYFDDAMPEVLEGIIPNTVYCERIQTINKTLSRFRSIRDTGPRSRLIVILISIIAVASLVFIRTVGSISVLFVIIVGLLCVIIILGLLSGRRISPAEAVRSVIKTFNDEDHARRRLHWVSIREESAQLGFRSRETPWIIAIDLLVGGIGTNPFEEADADEDALPMYEAGPPPFYWATLSRTPPSRVSLSSRPPSAVPPYESRSLSRASGYATQSVFQNENLLQPNASVPSVATGPPSQGELLDGPPP
ncbi:hypothetical protein DFJ73DRAFT_823622 [Zopfochytrium polystomum]|nr:hypothetical protein DFJ73DRAFT_823622 [Zopfochytrium polystomum]